MEKSFSGDKTSSTTTSKESGDIVIAVMGVTGAGKSGFIRMITGLSDVKVGHDLTSETSQIHQYYFAHNSISFVLIDTPGFNDTYESNETITSRILAWLETSFKSGTKLNGIIYLHRICEPRMQGSALENVRMFRQLCGDDALRNVVLATTFWDTVSLEVGLNREKELESNCRLWGTMVKKGSKIVRLGKDRAAGLAVLMEIAGKSKVELEVQKEMARDGKSIHDTAVTQSSISMLQKEMEARLAREKREAEEAIRKRESEERQRLTVEKARLKIEAENRRKQEEERRRREEARQAQQRTAELSNLQREAERKEKERIEQTERIECQKKEMERKAEEARAERQRYYNKYVCKRRPVANRRCNKCKKPLHRKWKYYYHCCHCDGDDYNHCGSCGKSCPVTEHPVMTQRKTIGECVIL